MKIARTLFKSAGWVFIILGLLHTVAHFSSPEKNSSPIFQQMKAYKIYLLGSYNLLQFYQGFSLMVGSLLLIYGLFVWLSARDNFAAIGKPIFLLNIVASLIFSLVAIVYLPPFVYGFCLTGFLLFSISAYKRFRSETLYYV